MLVDGFSHHLPEERGLLLYNSFAQPDHQLQQAGTAIKRHCSVFLNFLEKDSEPPFPLETMHWPTLLGNLSVYQLQDISPEVLALVQQ